MLTSKRKEKISAFLDNDMHRDELMSFSLSAEVDDAAQAQRYQLVGEALRGEMSDASFIDVSDAVREALADENLAAQMPVTEPEVSSHQASTERWSISSLFRPVAGMAVAASVAVVMVVSVDQQELAGVAPVASNTVNKVNNQPVLQLATEGKAIDGSLDTIAVNNPATESAQKVNQRLINQHLEFATQDTLQGRLPYVRAVSFEAEK